MLSRTRRFNRLSISTQVPASINEAGTGDESRRTHSGGPVEEALTDLQNAIRDKPEDSRLRVFLFQLQCALGRWDKALTQLQLLESLNDETMLLAQIFGPVINCEMLRAEIFAGKRTPIIFGEPMEWVGLLVKATSISARNEFAAALELRDQAFEAAPATPGTMDGKPFEWIADGDSRLGPSSK